MESMQWLDAVFWKAILVLSHALAPPHPCSSGSFLKKPEFIPVVKRKTAAFDTDLLFHVVPGYLRIEEQYIPMPLLRNDRDHRKGVPFRMWKHGMDDFAKRIWPVPWPSFFGPNNSQNGPVKLVPAEHGWCHPLGEGPRMTGNGRDADACSRNVA